MERQTLQQQVPVYHVCQQCGGDGCEACADLCIVEGDLSPINGVIGIKSSLQCPRCGKTDFDSPHGCQSPAVCSPAVGDWLCGIPGLSGAVSVSVK